MRLLLDTHALLWWLAGDPSLSSPAREAIASGGNEVLVSAASAWEITTKHRLGRLPGASVVAADVEACVREQGFVVLPISVRHGQSAGALPGPTRDPFDRMLVAQALAEGLTLVSNELALGAYGVALLW
ncbi:MAG: type II toxin-antitoxin system VapC family toxin [Alphaproteobacteria bacterium]|nr:type II toxin-antitoxin system VapC family toxin [Alphaproteobacteria bacterium]